MPKYTLEITVELARQVEDDMTNGQSKIRKKHQDSTTSSSSSSLDEKEVKSRKEKKNIKVWDKGQVKARKEKGMEEEKLLVVRLRLHEEHKALEKKS